MNAMKTLFVVAILLGCLYGVHQYLNGTSVLPDEVADDWDTGLKIDTGTKASATALAPQWSGGSSGTSAPPFQPVSATEPISSPPTPPAPLMPAHPDATQPPNTAPLGGGPTAVSPDEATELAKAAGFGEAPPYQAPGSPSGSIPSQYDAAGANPYAVSGPSSHPPAESNPYGSPAVVPYDFRGANPHESPSNSEPTSPPNPLTDPNPYAPNSPANPANPADPYGAPTANPTADPYGTPTADVPLGSQENYDTFMQRVSRSLTDERLAEAHLLMSQRYRDPATSRDEARRMEPLLDQLAGTVIYSSESYLEAPYEIIPTDTLESISNRYNVPPGLLIKINGLDPNLPLQPGQRIKVVRGPFEAVVDVQRQELILMLAGERYAGRFPIALGPDMRQEGSLMVTDKDPTHWRGARWIGLGQHMGLHDAMTPITPGQPLSEGCIGLNRRDIDDLYDILSVGSRVTIRR